MDRDRLKLIINNLKLLVDSLESEIYSDIEAYKLNDSKYKVIEDDDDGYPDWFVKGAWQPPFLLLE